MKKIHKTVLNILFLLYLLILLRITVFRSGFGLTHLLQNGKLNLTLFREYLPMIRNGRWGRFVYLFVGNIIWFIPFGGWLILSGKVKNVLTATLWGLGFSFLIESMQYIFGTGVSELDDLILNTAGTFIGALIMRAFRNKT